MTQCAKHGGECTPDAACWTEWQAVNELATRYKAEADRMEAHANEGWDLANDRTREMMKYKGALEEIQAGQKSYRGITLSEAMAIVKKALL